MKTTRFPTPTLSQFDPEDDETRSPAVKRVDRYVIDGRTHCTFEEAIASREDKIEAFVRHLFREASPRAQVEAVQWVLDNRAELRRLLDY